MTLFLIVNWHDGEYMELKYIYKDRALAEEMLTKLKQIRASYSSLEIEMWQTEDECISI